MPETQQESIECDRLTYGNCSWPSMLTQERRYTAGWRARMRLPDGSKYGRLATIRPGSFFDKGWADAQRRCWARYKREILMKRMIFVRDPRQKVMDA